MKTYSTYQEAKIANPECEIFHCVQFGFATGDISTASLLWVKCNPADYCMTADKFLKDGHEFVDGDLILGVDGNVLKLKLKNPSSRKITGDNKRFILRANALEPKKPRTRVEYVNCDFRSTHDAYSAMLNGVELFSSDGIDRFKFDGKNFIGENGVEEWKLECHSDKEQFYRKVETEIDWRDDVIDYLESFGCDECRSFIEAIKEHKHTGACNHHFNGFVDMCKLVAQES